MIDNEFTDGRLPSTVLDFAPETGVILGSGLGSFVDRLVVDHSTPFSEIDGLPASKVPGHEGRFVCGRLGTSRLLVAQGRVHFYEGHSASGTCAGVRAMVAAGCHRIVLTNAAGTLNAAMPVGEWMVLSDHLNLTGASPLQGGAHFVDMTEVYSSTLRGRFLQAASVLGVPLHEGVYAGLQGPQYETPAEVRMLRTLGADAVGMSTVLEAIMARALGVEVAGFSCLTNWAAGISGEALHHGEVLEVGQEAAAKLVDLLTRVLGEEG